MLPTLTTFVIGAPLTLLPDGTTWWVGFSFAAILLVIVFLAEYITIDPTAPTYGFARAGLGLSLRYALFLILATSLRFRGAHVFTCASSFIVSALICLRILHLDGTDRWDFPWAIGIGIVSAQISVQACTTGR